MNLLVGEPSLGGAPVVFEDSPSYDNLIGRVEHVAQCGTLHRADGGGTVNHAVIGRLTELAARRQALASLA